MKTNAAKLKDWQDGAAKRQARRRQRLAEAGRPDTSRVDTAIIEAVSFAITQTAVSTLHADPGADAVALRETLSIPYALVRDTALTILVDRSGFDLDQCKRVVGRRLAPRKPHFDRTNTPHLRPLSPPSMDGSTSQGKSSDTPVTSSNQVT